MLLNVVIVAVGLLAIVSSTYVVTNRADAEGSGWRIAGDNLVESGGALYRVQEGTG